MSKIKGLISLVLMLVLLVGATGCTAEEETVLVSEYEVLETENQDKTKEFKNESDKLEKEKKDIVKVNVEPVDTSCLSYKKHILKVEYLPQNPELPTGCEITSLTTVLNYYGFDVTKTEMAKEYLPKAPAPASFWESFIGDPFTSYGFGCYAKPITKAANDFFTDQNAGYTAYDKSGVGFEALLLETEQGRPVIIWGTMGMKTPYYTYEWEANGKKIKWIAPEHCLVLIGYDLENSMAVFCDPQMGRIGYPLDIVKKRYAALHFQCVIVVKD